MTTIATYIHAFVLSAMERVHGEERGQDLLEWVLLSGLIAAGIIAVAVLFTPWLTDMINNVGACLDFDNTTPCTPGF